jgi:hypothetical protein
MHHCIPASPTQANTIGGAFPSYKESAPMMRILQLLDEVFYGLAVLGLVVGVILKLGIIDSTVLHTTTRGSLLFAGVMFLAVIATKSIAADEPSS